MKKEIVIPMLFFIAGFLFSMWGIFKESFTIQQKIAVYFVGGVTIFWGLVTHHILEHEKHKAAKKTKNNSELDLAICLQNYAKDNKVQIYRYASEDTFFEETSLETFIQKLGLEVLKNSLGRDLEYHDVSEEYPSYMFYYTVGNYGEVGYKGGKFYASFDGVYANDLPTIKDVREFFLSEAENSPWLS